MTRTLNTAAAARLAGTTVRTIRTWCQRQAVAATKVGRRWFVELSSLLRRLNAARPRVTGWLRAGERPAVRVGRTLRRYEARHAARSTGHRLIGHHDRALIAVANAGRITAVEYLLAIGFPEAERYASAFGRAVAAQYRKSHGEDPYDACLVVVRGRIHRVFGYEAIEDLQAGAYSYARTREFLADRRVAALHALAA